MLYLYSQRAEGAGARPRVRLSCWGSWASCSSWRRPPSRRSSSARSANIFRRRASERYRVAFLAGCIANVAFARLNEATVRVLQKNGCEVVIPGRAGLLRRAARPRRDAGRGRRAGPPQYRCATRLASFDAIITNAAGCGSTLKEYGELLEDDPSTPTRREFAGLMRDVTEFLASIELNRDMGAVNATVTYQDSCHLAHGQKIRTAPRKLLAAIPGLTLREMRGRRYLLRQRRHLQRGAERDVDAGPRKQDGGGQRDRRRGDRHRESGMHAAACRRACGCTEEASG